MQDLLPGVPGCLLKDCVRDGAGWETPRDTASVKLAVHTAVATGELETSSLPGFEKQSLEFIVGNGDVCDALEFAVCAMKKGEVALLTCTDPALCQEPRLGLQDVRLRDGMTSVIFKIELLHFSTSGDPADFSEEERLRYASERKQVGSNLFKAGRLRLAVERYKKVAELFGYVENLSPSSRASAIELRKACLLNMAACQLRLNDFSSAKAACTGVLADESGNWKALYRRAQACLELGEPKAAWQDLRSIVERDPQHREARELLKVVKSRLNKEGKDEDGKDRETFGKMCEALGKGPIPEPFVDPKTKIREEMQEEWKKNRKKEDLPPSPNFTDLPRVQQDVLMGKMFGLPDEYDPDVEDLLEKEGVDYKLNKKECDDAFLDSKAAWPDSDSDED